MKVTGKFKEAELTLDGRLSMKFDINEKTEAISQLDSIKDCDKLTIEIKKYRAHRSKDANALLWACLGEMAEVLRTDKWQVYLLMLKRYGQFTYTLVKPVALDMFKASWRECEEVGRIEVNGEEAVQVLCYFGSSTYDSREFSILLDGVVSEMKELGLQPPPSEEMRRCLEKWEEQTRAKEANVT